MDDKRAILADHVDDRVTITGMFDKHSLQTNAVRQWRVTLLQDVYAEIDGKDIDLGHVWIQHAEALKNLDLVYGDRIRCNCRILTYKKRLRVPNKDGLMIVPGYSLSWPTDIEVLNRAQRTKTVTMTSPPESDLMVPSLDQPEDPIEAMRQVRGFIKACGSAEQAERCALAMQSVALPLAQLLKWVEALKE